MFYPELYTVSKSRDMTANFGGLNKTHTCSAGEWVNEDGLTSKYYPTLCPKRSDKPEKLTNLPESTTGKLLALKYFSNGERIAVYEKGILWGEYDEFYEHDMNPYGRRTSIVEFGDYAVIYPQNLYVDRGISSSEGLCVDVIDKINFSSSYKLQLTKLDGTAYQNIKASDTEPENPASGDYWLDTGESQWLYYWDGVRETWQSVSTMYIKISSPGIGSGFNQYDAINIKWGYTEDDGSLPTDAAFKKVPDLFGSHVLEVVSKDYIIITGFMNAAEVIIDGDTVNEPLTFFARETPQMDYVFGHKNRLWGCRYGTDIVSGRRINEIYASKLGDFRNWNAFEGISTDSWVATIGTGGAFTDALVYNDRPTFFKDDRIITITGDFASEFRTSETVCESIGLSGTNSAQVVNGVLYYVSKYGICAYTGGFPTRVSDNLGYGIELTVNASAVRKDTYCLWAEFKDEDGNHGEHLIELDTSKGIWHITKTQKESVTRLAAQDTLGKVHRASGNIGVFITDEGEYKRKWSAESGLLTMSYPGGKYVSNFQIRAELAEDAKVDFAVMYEGDDEWRHLETLCGATDRSIHTFTVRNIPRRCDHYRMRFEGVGKCKIYSICYDIEQGR